MLKIKIKIQKIIVINLNKRANIYSLSEGFVMITGLCTWKWRPWEIS